jgi:hypothetical protein
MSGRLREGPETERHMREENYRASRPLASPRDCRIDFSPVVQPSAFLAPAGTRLGAFFILWNGGGAERDGIRESWAILIAWIPGLVGGWLIGQEKLLQRRKRFDEGCPLRRDGGGRTIRGEAAP